MKRKKGAKIFIMQIPGLNLINGSAIQYAAEAVLLSPKEEAELSSSNHVEDTSPNSPPRINNDQQNGDPSEIAIRKIFSIPEQPIADPLDLALEALSDPSSLEPEGDHDQDSDDAERYHYFVRLY